MGKNSPLLVFFSIFLILTGCFTGIESTPKITAGDLKREKVVLQTEEQIFSNQIKPLPLSEWTVGREYIIDDSKIRLVFPTTPADKLPQKGDTIYFCSAVETPSPLGGNATNLTFRKKNDPTALLTYRIDYPIEILEKREKIDVPFTIDLSLVELADSLLRNKSLYILSPYWLSFDLKDIPGRKFISVTIDKVSPGTFEYPMKISFTDENGYSGNILLTVGTSKSSTRNFATTFSFKNPRDLYPSITDENWKAITLSRVRPEMTREEARLALGSPKEVVRGHDHSSSYEQWVYTNGVYLIFQDGLLNAYRL